MPRVLLDYLMIDKDNIMVGVPENEHGSCRLNCQNEFNLKDFWGYLRLLAPSIILDI